MKKTYYRSLGDEVEILDVRKLSKTEIPPLNPIVDTLKSIIKKRGNLTDTEWKELDEGLINRWEISFAFTSQMRKAPKTFSMFIVHVKGHDHPDKDTIIKAIKDQLGEREAKKETLGGIIHTKFNPWE